MNEGFLGAEAVGDNAEPTVQQAHPLREALLRESYKIRTSIPRYELEEVNSKKNCLTENCIATTREELCTALYGILLSLICYEFSFACFT
jgi:hypothetical protein